MLGIIGPTASGKSAVAEYVAQKLSGRILSVDAFQVYKGMDIGTAKVPHQDRSVAYDMIDCVDITAPYSVALYQRAARACIEKNKRCGVDTILCGGAGFYLDALIDDIDFIPSANYYEEYLSAHGKDALHRLLREKDPKSAEIISASNPRRVIRALEMLEHNTTYTQRNATLKRHKPFYSLALYTLEWPREVLFERINKRVDDMFDNGLVDEVIALKDQLCAATTAAQAIGYKEILEWLEPGKNTLSEDEINKVKTLIKKRTRNYAKRQLSWLRRDGRARPIAALNKDAQEIGEEILQDFHRQQKAPRC